MLQSAVCVKHGSSADWRILWTYIRYVQTLKKLKQRIRKVLPNRKVNQILLHDNARSHTSLRTGEAVAILAWTVLLYSLYSHDLATSNFHIFGPLNDALRGRRFAEKTWNTACVMSSEASVTRRMRTAFSFSRAGGKIVLIKENFRQNNLNFVKHVTMIHLNLLKKYSLWVKNRRHYFRTTPLI